MPLSFACSSCGAKLRAPDNATGRTFKCPQCGMLVTVGPVASQTPTAAKTTTTTTKREMKKRETTMLVRCRTCGSLLEITLVNRHEKQRCEVCQQCFVLVADGSIRRLEPILPTQRPKA